MKKIKLALSLLVVSLSAYSKLDPVLSAGISNAGLEVSGQMKALHPYKTGSYQYYLGTAMGVGLLVGPNPMGYVQMDSLLQMGSGAIVGLGFQYYVSCSEVDDDERLDVIPMLGVSYQQKVSYLNDSELCVRVSTPVLEDDVVIAVDHILNQPVVSLGVKYAIFTEE